MRLILFSLFVFTVTFGCTSNKVVESPTPERTESMVAAPEPNTHPNTAIVGRFIQSFNDRKLSEMLSVVSDDVQWLSVVGDKITVVTGSKDELENVLKSYFKECTSCRSSVGNMIATEKRVSVAETTSWESNGKIGSQSSLSVYEINDSLIHRVYYFEEE